MNKSLGANARGALLAALVLSLQGCALGVQTYVSYEGVVDDTGIRTRRFPRSHGELGGKGYALPDLLLSADSINYPTSLTTTMIIPLVQRSHDVTAAPGNFQVGLVMRPDAAGFVFDPSKVFLLTSASETHHPVRIIGPLDRAIPYEKRTKEELAWRNPDEKPIALNLNRTVIIDLEFDVPIPTHGDSYSLRVEGLQFNGQSYAVPVIRFAEITHHDPVGAP